MTLAMTLNVVLVAINLLLLTVLLGVYGRMLRRIRTNLTLGLLAFASVLWIQSAVQLYFYATMMSYFAGAVEGLVLVQNALATLASAFLTFVTLFPGASKREARTPDSARKS